MNGSLNVEEEFLSNLWSGNLGILGLKVLESSKSNVGTTGSSKCDYSGEPVLQPGQTVCTADIVQGDMTFVAESYA